MHWGLFSNNGVKLAPLKILWKSGSQVWLNRVSSSQLEVVVCLLTVVQSPFLWLAY